MKINYVGFYSEGGDKDRGIDLTKEKKTVEQNLKGNVDGYMFYTPSMLKKMGYSNHMVDYEEPGLVSANAGMNHIGNCAWRPLIILLELQKLNDGDVIVYRDINCVKYPSLKNFDNFKKTIKKVLDFYEYDFAIFRQNEKYVLEQFCKPNIIDEVAIDKEFTKNFPLALSGYVIFKKTDVSIEFLKEWDRLCLVDEYINGQQYGELSPKFKWFTPEQAIMGVLLSNWVYERKHNIPKTFPNFMWDDNRNYIDYSIAKNYDYLKIIHESPVIEGFGKNNDMSYIVLLVLLLFALIIHFNIYLALIFVVAGVLYLNKPVETFQNKGLVILYGDNCRDRRDGVKRKDTHFGYLSQMEACDSHVKFINYIKKKEKIDIDVSITTYDTKYESEIKKKYDNLIQYSSEKKLIGLNPLFAKCYKDIKDKADEYSFILFIRLDLILKDDVKKTIKLGGNKILFCWQEWTRGACFTNKEPRVATCIYYFPKKYFYILDKGTDADHNIMDYIKRKYKLTNDHFGFMINTFHASHPVDDWNPLYYFAGYNKNQNKTYDEWHDKDVINGFNEDNLIRCNFGTVLEVSPTK